MAEDIYNIRISSCFVHFDGVTEQLCKVTRQRLKKILDGSSKWAKLNCQQAEIAKKSYENIDDGLSRRKITRQSEIARPKMLFFPPTRSSISNHAKNPCSKQKMFISSVEFATKPSPMHVAGVRNTLSTSNTNGISCFTAYEICCFHFKALSIESSIAPQNTMAPSKLSLR